MAMAVCRGKNVQEEGLARAVKTCPPSMLALLYQAAASQTTPAASSLPGLAHDREHVMNMSTA